MKLGTALSAGMKVALAIAMLSSPALARDDRLDGIRGEGARAAGWSSDDGDGRGGERGRGDRGPDKGRGGDKDRGGRGGGRGGGGRHSVPEFDPAAAGAIAALLASGALTIAHRRKR